MSYKWQYGGHGRCRVVLPPTPFCENWERSNSPYINHFISADTIIPGSANPQNLNRYSYVLNNPMRYTDPTGHKFCDGESEGECSRYSTSIEDTARKYRIRFKGNWKVKNQLAVLAGVEMVGAQFAATRGLGESGSSAFGAVYGHLNIGWGGTGAQGMCAGVTSGGCTTNSHQINFWSLSGQLFNDTSRMVKNVVHELGHALDNSLTYKDPNTGKSRRPDQDIPGGITRDTVLRPNPIPGRLDWQQNPQNTSNEFFADMFIAWTYNAWNTNSTYQLRVDVASDWMSSLVP